MGQLKGFQNVDFKVSGDLLLITQGAATIEIPLTHWQAFVTTGRAEIRAQTP